MRLINKIGIVIIALLICSCATKNAQGKNTQIDTAINISNNKNSIHLIITEIPEKYFGNKADIQIVQAGGLVIASTSFFNQNIIINSEKIDVFVPCITDVFSQSDDYSIYLFINNNTVQYNEGTSIKYTKDMFNISFTDCVIKRQ